jgi:hypothetical protein
MSAYESKVAWSNAPQIRLRLISLANVPSEIIDAEQHEMVGATFPSSNLLHSLPVPVHGHCPGIHEVLVRSSLFTGKLCNTSAPGCVFSTGCTRQLHVVLDPLYCMLQPLAGPSSGRSLGVTSRWFSSFPHSCLKSAPHGKENGSPWQGLASTGHMLQLLCNGQSHVSTPCRSENTMCCSLAAQQY